MDSTVSDDFPTLTGRQEPIHFSIFDGDTSIGEKVIELRRRAGQKTMPWQQFTQLGICSTSPSDDPMHDGWKWTHPTACIICTRQNGKSEILIDRCLYGLFKLKESILYTAQRWKTARDAWSRLIGIIRSRSWLKKHVVRATCSQGEGIIELDNGATIGFGTRSNDTGRGLTDVDLLIYDEAYNLTSGEITAMSFTQSAATNPQRIYASSAVNQEQHPNGGILAAVRERGLRGAARMFFAEWMAPDDPTCCDRCAEVGVLDRDDPDTWRFANPSFGVVHSEEKIDDLKSDMNTAEARKGFDVDALGRGDWPQPDTEREHVIDMDAWTLGEISEARFAGDPVIALSVAPDRQTWSITAGRLTVAGPVLIESGFYGKSDHAGIVSRVEALVADWDPAAIVIDSRSRATVIVSKLAAAGIEPELFHTAQVADACAGLIDDIETGMVVHSGQDELTLAADVVQRRVLPQGDFVLDQTLWTVPDLWGGARVCGRVAVRVGPEGSAGVAGWWNRSP
ncbi:hypothetical protein [Gordonia sp. SND2]|uniref:hypothetical protein n=1 Tax=Gordonia sp. SND2 TaxID=3388659 RepID=UPI00398B281C